MDLLGCVHPPSPGQRGCRGVLFFMIKQKIIRDKMRYSNLSNNMIISHSRTQSPSYARSTERDEGLWPNPYQTGI